MENLLRKMDDDVCIGDVPLVKYITNSREPFVVETKTTTTTTTTTVTKRICLPKDANLDPAEIQSLLNGENPTPITPTKNVSCIVPPNANVITDHTATTIEDKGATQILAITKSAIIPNKDQNQTLLSSTKIDNSSEPPQSDKITENDLPDPPTEFLSPNFSDIGNDNQFKVNDKNVQKPREQNPMPKIMKPKNMDAPLEQKQRSTRSKKNATKSSVAGSPKEENYIDDLISEYMALEKKPRRKKSSPKVEKPPTPQTPTYPDLKDLSAIFENSLEGQASPLTARLSSVSPIDFNGASNVGYCMGSVDYESPANNQFSDVSVSDANEPLPADSPLKEIVKNTRKKRNLPQSPDKREAVSTANDGGKSRKTTKKVTKTTKSANKPIKTEKSSILAISHQSKSGFHSPIKIYSPSGRSKLRSKSDKLVLTKKMIEKKLQSLPKSSKTLLNRLSRSHDITVDADSRLVYYPNENENDDSGKQTIDDDNDDTDILSVMALKRKPLLVKEIIG